jgi:hypothetical protein
MGGFPIAGCRPGLTHRQQIPSGVGRDGPVKRIALVGCSRSKLQHRAPAGELYTSNRFTAARQYAESHCDQWFILSAKHGLVKPGHVLEPYDLTLIGLNAADRLRWSRRVIEDLGRVVNRGDKVVILAAPEYEESIKPGLVSLGARVRAGPEPTKSTRQLSLLPESQLESVKVQDTNRIYQLLDRLSARVGGLVSADKVLSRKDLPASGVYFFFEPGEARAHNAEVPRVVRVGTHGVSRGSESTLRDRLRTHLGTHDGGNHRTSIFRLHIGESYLNRERSREEVPTWGGPPPTSKHGLLAEKQIEMWVSEYLRKMSVLWLPVPGKSSKFADRAVLERNCISLLSGIPIPIDPPSSSWLGRWSSRPAVRRSGLWNIQHTSAKYHAAFLAELDRLIEAPDSGTSPFSQEPGLDSSESNRASSQDTRGSK